MGLPRALGAPLTLAETEHLAGAWAWVERSLYEVVGAWVAQASAPGTKVYYDSASQHHAWRGQLWLDRLPPRRALVEPVGGAGAWVAPQERAEAVMKSLSNLDGDIGRLGTYCRVVLPRMVVAYRQWQARCSPYSDRPVARALNMVLADIIADWQDGSALLVEALSGEQGEQGAVLAASASAEVERLVVPGGLVPHAW